VGVDGLGPCGASVSAVSCTNNVGSYICDCNDGYYFHRGTCKGIIVIVIKKIQYIIFVVLPTFEVMVHYGEYW